MALVINACLSAKEEKLDILTIPLSPNINSSLSKFLKPEILESENKWFCPLKLPSLVQVLF